MNRHGWPPRTSWPPRSSTPPAEPETQSTATATSAGGATVAPAASPSAALRLSGAEPLWEPYIRQVTVVATAYGPLAYPLTGQPNTGFNLVNGITTRSVPEEGATCQVGSGHDGRGGGARVADARPAHGGPRAG